MSRSSTLPTCDACLRGERFGFRLAVLQSFKTTSATIQTPAAMSPADRRSYWSDARGLKLAFGSIVFLLGVDDGDVLARECGEESDDGLSRRDAGAAGLHRL